MRGPRARRAGFTLIELLVSVAMLGIIVVYLLRSFTVQHRTYTVVDETTEMQQNLRAVADLLERDLRHAGMMVPESGAVCGVDATDGPDVLFVSDADAIEPGTEKVADFGADLTTATTVADASTETLELDGLVAEPAPLRAAYDTDADGAADSDFREGAGVIVTDLADPDLGAACGVVDGIPSATEITVIWRSEGLEAAGTDLVAIPAHVYQVVNGALERDGNVLVENVDDFQVAYFFDGDGDALVDANEYRGVTGVAYDPSDAAIEEDKIREVRANLVLRSRFEDPTWTQGVFQNLENRAAVAGTDGFRRRVHTATVRLRNVGNR